MADITIENVIATLDFNSNLDLKNIADSIETAEYNPDQFPGLIYKLRSPKTITLMFSRGHCVCSGATSISNAKAALTIIYKKLKDLNLTSIETIPEITIKDIVVSSRYEKRLELKTISEYLPAMHTTYNPTEFPGIVYHDKPTDIRVLIFNSGTVVGYGNPHLANIQDILAELEKFFK
jgi:transcription initiation factor TFIID TATA-box-binding protein